MDIRNATETSENGQRRTLWASVIGTIKKAQQDRVIECVGELVQRIEGLDEDPHRGPASGAGTGNAFKMGGPYALAVRGMICEELDGAAWDEHAKLRLIGRTLGSFLASLRTTNDLMKEDFERHVQACRNHLARSIHDAV